MKRIIAALILTATIACAAGPQPPKFTFTWNGQGTTGLADTNTWLSNVSYLLTNCPFQNGTNGAVDLTGCGIIIRVGDSTTNVAYSGAVQSPATSGLFSCTFQIPNATNTATSSSTITLNGAAPLIGTAISHITNIQLTITNATVSVTDKEQKQLQYQAPLQ